MKTKCVSRYFISSVFTSERRCPKIPYFELLTCINVQLKTCFLSVDRIKLDYCISSLERRGVYLILGLLGAAFI